MGLAFPDLASWQHWQNSQRRLRVIVGRWRSVMSRADQDETLTFWVRGSDPGLLIACDSTSPTNYFSLLSPLEADPTTPAVVAAPAHIDLGLAPGKWTRADQSVLDAVRVVASIGDHLRVGAWAHHLAASRGLRELVVQHGLLTPFSPPPPHGAAWLAWSDRDIAFVRDGREDLDGHVVGAPLLEAAAARPSEHVSRFETPVFLGQLHGAELSRVSMARSVSTFWRRTGAIYRPHPREEDKLSRVQHHIWKSLGMKFDSARSLQTIDRPVVSAFSTGVLEAATRGIPAWVFHLNPPVWLEEFWDRYDMSRWGDSPTPPPELGFAGSSQRIAQLFREAST